MRTKHAPSDSRCTWSSSRTAMFRNNERGKQSEGQWREHLRRWKQSYTGLALSQDCLPIMARNTWARLAPGQKQDQRGTHRNDHGWGIYAMVIDSGESLLGGRKQLKIRMSSRSPAVEFSKRFLLPWLPRVSNSILGTNRTFLLKPLAYAPIPSSQCRPQADLSIDTCIPHGRRHHHQPL